MVAEGRTDPGFVSVRDGVQALRVLDPDLVEALAGRLACRKPGHVMDILGISLNTWNKIQQGQAIRASVALRLERRFGIPGDHGGGLPA